MSFSSVQPGDIIVDTLTVKSDRGSIDLAKGFQRASVYESILTPGIVAMIVVKDTDDQIGQMKLQGDEMVEFVFRVPGGETAKYQFALNKAESSDYMGAMKSKNYNLQCVSEEALHAKANPVLKDYSNKQISDIVKDIHKNYLKSSKNIDVEDTKGPQKILGQNQKPYQFIDVVRRRAVSSDNKSSSYVFFENREGYKFMTIEKLFKESAVKTFKMENTVGHDINSQTDNNIMSFTVPKTFSATERINHGSLKSDTATFDFETNQYKINKDVKPAKMQTGGKGEWNSSTFEQKYGQTPGRRLIHPVDSRIPQTHISETSPNQLAYLAKLLQNTIQIRVPGDTKIMAGNIIEANIPNMVSTTGNNSGETQLSGKFLVVKLHHCIGGAAEKPRYTCILECVKGDPEK